MITTINYFGQDSSFIIIKNCRLNQTGFNMVTHISDISPKVKDAIIEATLNKILEADINLNGFVWKVFRYEDCAEIFCYISSEANTISDRFFEHYSRLLTETALFSPKTRKEVLEEIKFIMSN